MFDDLIGKFTRAFLANECDGLKRLLEGLGNTMIIALCALVVGIVLGIFFAILKVIPQNGFLTKIPGAIANIYIGFFRGTPVMVQLLLMYYGIFATSGMPAIIIAIACFGMNSGAYVAEIIRSGILAVDRGQMEAGRSLGLPYRVTMFRIVLPQAIKNILPALGNELIALIKETSVAGFITVFDMTRAARAIVAKTYEAFVPYCVLALAYLLIVIAASFLVGRLERRMRQSDRH